MNKKKKGKRKGKRKGREKMGKGSKIIKKSRDSYILGKTMKKEDDICRLAYENRRRGTTTGGGPGRYTKNVIV